LELLLHLAQRGFDLLLDLVLVCHGGRFFDSKGGAWIEKGRLPHGGARRWSGSTGGCYAARASDESPASARFQPPACRRRRRPDLRSLRVVRAARALARGAGDGAAPCRRA